MRDFPTIRCACSNGGYLDVTSAAKGRDGVKKTFAVTASPMGGYSKMDLHRAAKRRFPSGLRAVRLHEWQQSEGRAAASDGAAVRSSDDLPLAFFALMVEEVFASTPYDVSVIRVGERARLADAKVAASRLRKLRA